MSTISESEARRMRDIRVGAIVFDGKPIRDIYAGAARQAKIDELRDHLRDAHDIGFTRHADPHNMEVAHATSHEWDNPTHDHEDTP